MDSVGVWIPLETLRSTTPHKTGTELPPLLHKLVADYAATGRPPAYLPKHDNDSEAS